MADLRVFDWRIWAASLVLVAVPIELRAQAVRPVSSPAAATLLPGNTARCVYEYMSEEDREIALLLFAKEAIDGGKFRKSSKNVQVVDRLIEEAHDKCLDRFAWSIGRSDSAKSYALTAILGEGLRQVMTVDGLAVDRIDIYFTTNRAALVGKTEIEGPDKKRFITWLIAEGWDAEKFDMLNMAALYLETQLLLDRTQRAFTSSGGATRQTAKSRPYPARKARRGTP